MQVSTQPEPAGPREDDPRKGDPREDDPRQGDPREDAPRRGQAHEATLRGGAPREAASRDGQARELSPRAGEPAWRLPSWVALIAGVLLLAATVTIGEIVRSQGPARTGELAFDVTLSHHRDAVGSVLAESISIVLGPIVGPLLVVVACVILWRLRARLTAALLAALSASGWLVSGLVKVAVHRDRPPTRVVHALLLENAPDSFPSGHTALITAVFATMVTIAWMLNRPLAQRVGVTVVGVLVVAAVAASRLYLGVHYFYDVLAAPLVAVGGVLIAAYLAPRVILLLVGRSTHAAHWLDVEAQVSPQNDAH